MTKRLYSFTALALLFFAALFSCSKLSDVFTFKIYKVIYNSNGADAGTVPVDPALYATGETVTIAANTSGLTKTLAQFAGWSTREDGSGTLYQPGDSVTIGNEDLVLWAVFTPTAPTTINLLMIPGVTAPMTGATPVTSLDTTQYAGTISWSPTVSDTFSPLTIYTATITLMPKAGYILTGVAADSFTVAGTTSVTNSADSGVVTAVFPVTKTFTKRLIIDAPMYGPYIAHDGFGNIYVTTNISGNEDLNGDGDSTDGGAESATGYGSEDIVIIKFNAEGTYQWAKRLGGINGDRVYYITCDKSENIYVTGHVAGNADLNGDGDNTDGGAESATGYGNNDIFISKFNCEGEFQWAKRLGTIYNDYGRSLACDSIGNIYVTGSVTGNADLNGDGDSTDGGAESGAGYGNNDSFISKFNGDGTFQWAKRLGGANEDSGYSLACDSIGNIYMTGYINGNADLNGDGDSSDGGAESGAGYGNYDSFISKFNGDGTFQWAKRLGGLGYDYGYYIKCDCYDNINLIGRGDNNLDINGDGDSTDGGAESSSGYGSSDIFITTFNGEGSYRWSKRLGGTDADYGYSLTCDGLGNIYMTGCVAGNADLNGDGDNIDGGAESATGYGGKDIFISKFSTDGYFQWAKRLGGIYEDNGYSLFCDTCGSVYITGYVTGNADLNGDGDNSDGGEESSSQYNRCDSFIVKFNAAGLPQ